LLITTVEIGLNRLKLKSSFSIPRHRRWDDLENCLWYCEEDFILLEICMPWVVLNIAYFTLIKNENLPH
jgi:hypothetical protein